MSSGAGHNDVELATATTSNGAEEDHAQTQDSDSPAEERHESSVHDHGHGDPADHVKDAVPWRIHVWVAAYPCASCWFMCLWFVVCAVIAASIPGLLYFTQEVPFYIRDNECTELKDSLWAGMTEAQWEREETTYEEAQQETTADVNMRLVFIVKDGDTLMTDKYLSLIEEIETTIKETDGYENYCKRVYGDNGTYECSRETSLTNFFDASYWVGALDQNYTLDPSIGNTANYLFPSTLMDATAELTDKDYSEDFINKITTYWAGYGNGEGSAEDYSPKYYDGVQMPAQFWYRMPDAESIATLMAILANGTSFSDINITKILNFQDFTLSNVFAQLADKDFAYDSPLDTNVRGAMSAFTFGYPLEGYNSSSDDTDDQELEISEWCYNELHDVFTEWQEKHEDDLEFYWSCASMDGLYALEVLMRDAMLMGLTFASVYALMIINTGSVWLATCGMGMIFLNFGPALLLYGAITQQSYFGTLCVMAMFIILAIGADDIFVIVDTWQQYRTAAPDEPMEKRMTATLKHAGKVMATTSASTCFSFIANVTSAFPAVYTFGYFAAWLVFVNYCAVCLFYPTVLAVHDTYFYTPKLKKAACCPQQCEDKECATNCCFGKCPNTKSDEEGQDKERPIDKFCQYKYFPFILKNRGSVITITGLFFLIFMMMAAQIEPDPETPQFYPNGNNYQEYGDALSDNFASETDQQQQIYLVWGIDGIDREGTDPTDDEDIGEVIWSENVPNFALSEEEQLYIAQISDDLMCVYNSYSCRYTDSFYYDLLISDPAAYGDEEINVLKSPMQHFRTWVQEDTDAKPDTDTLQDFIDDYDLTKYWEDVTPSTFDNCTWGVFPVNGSHCFSILWYYIWANDDLPTSNPDFAAGTTNYDYWKDYMRFKECNDEDECTSNFGIELKFLYVTVMTEVTVSYNYLDGLDQYADWQTYGDNWRDNVAGVVTADQNGDEFVKCFVSMSLVSTPTSLQSIMVTDLGYFGYFFIQEKIIQEAAFGICLSLFFAFIVLTIATGNWVMAMYSCIVIFSIVMCVIGFTVANGWKLGVIEAIIYVMVVGMSVDYVVHLSEAYLASGKRKREDRTMRMLGIVGSAVLSGALSTMIGIFWLLFATISIFLKFGSFIFFLIACSCVFSLVSFTAVMSAIGPEGDKGDIRVLYRKCRTRCGGDGDESDAAVETSSPTPQRKPSAQHENVQSEDSEIR